MRSIRLILLATVVSLAGGTSADELGDCGLTVVVHGVRNAEGSVGVLVFASKEGWPNDRDLAFVKQGVPSRQGDVEVVFDEVPSGPYAIAVTHDENGNKKLDRSASGRPIEGWGMSKDPKARFKTPSFSKALIDVECDDRVDIRMQYRKKSGGDQGS